MSIDRLPDVRDGLAREQRIVLYVLSQLQKERGDRNVPTPPAVPSAPGPGTICPPR